MTNAMVSGGLVRVSVVHHGRRADLVVPGVVTVADLLPDLVAAVGALDPYTAHAGYRLVRQDGERLRSDAGLVGQGVEDGHVLVVEAGVEDAPPRVYDDVVEAVADSIEAQSRAWTPEASRRTALVAAAALLLVAAGALGLQRATGLPVAVAAGAGAVLLLTAGTVLSRSQRAHETALLLAWTAVPFAAVAGWAALPSRPVLDLPSVVAGVAVVVVGGLAAVGLAERSLAMLPALGLGGLLAIVGAVTAATSFPPAAVVATVLVLLVLVGAVVPWLSVSATRLDVPAPRSEAEVLADPLPLEPADVEREVRSGREVLLALTVSVSAVVALATPFAVSLGVAGSCVALCACAALLLRTRQYRDAVEVRAGVLGGAVGLVVAAVAAALLHPEWRTVLTVALLALGAALVLAAAVPRTPSVRLGRLGDVLEGVALVAMLPLLVFAVGLV